MPYRAVKMVYAVCSRCGHEWIPRHKGSPPETCPKCRSPYWDKPRVRLHSIKASRAKPGAK